MNTTASGDNRVTEEISHRDFLKLICTADGIFMLSTLIPIGKVLGMNVISSKNTRLNGTVD